MNLYTITRPNSKGQIVIPKKMREKLGIDEGVLLNVSMKNDGVYITVLDKPFRISSEDVLILEILKKTAGSWVNDDWGKYEGKRRKVEINAARNRKKAW